MIDNLPLVIAVVAVAASVFLFGVVFLAGAGTNSVEARIADATKSRRRSGSSGTASASKSGSTSKSSGPLPQLGNLIMPKDASRKQRLRDRLLQAGLYQRHSTAVYLGLKVLLMILPVFAGLGLSTVGMLPPLDAVAYGAAAGLFGTLFPTAYLNSRKRGRQKQLRRALPDALDVIVICMEGGLSLSASLERVANELNTAHPLLASEMSIVRQEMTLGLGTGEALRNFAMRFDVEELRSLSSVVMQAERYGASIVKALKVHAETLRLKRYQHAEAMAQKAPLKIVFPTALCIFPPLYVILIGPAIIIIYKAFSGM